ncbi:glycosyltransferase family 2 protein [Candidatus Woesearchaeota archaeon]|nr:glycosyltransferase family 2 protein [Candidatus Woesearchaeota archaeon]
MTKFLSVVVPCYNESKIISSTFLSILNFLSSKKYSYEIIFCNDGSTDNTLEKLLDIKRNYNFVKIISFSKNMGLGYSMKKLFDYSDGEYVIQLDADLSTPVTIIDSILLQLLNNDVVIASRYHKNSSVKISFKRLFLSRVYNLFIRVLFGVKLNDTQSGFVGFRRHVVKAILFKSRRFDYHIEFMTKITRASCRIKEIPSLYVHRERDSKFNIFKDGLDTLYSTFKLFWKLNYGKN